jgi:3-oxoacyl-[acyl-carrier protein] reductase
MRTVLITGGTRGIGAATVRKFAEYGDRVFFLYEKSRELAETIFQETGAQGFQCDVSDEAQVKEVFSQIGPVDVLVNNAGIVDYGPINWVSAETFRRIMDVNVTGMFLCCQAALSGMLQKQQGAIVNLSSMWGRVGSSCEVAYSASKGAVIAMTKALAKELGPSGIRVNAVAPGVILTDMVENVSQETLEELRQETPLEKLGRPEDVANAIFYLASPQASFVTGTVLDVSGGFVM